MGLDGIGLIMEVEDVFGIRIADEDARLIEDLGMD